MAAIDDRAHHDLRGLLDDVFGAKNYLATVVVDSGQAKNRANYVAAAHSYLLFYARDKAAYRKAVPRWREPIAGADELLSAACEAWAAADGDTEAALDRMVTWFKQLPERSPLRTLSRYRFILPDGALARDDNAGAPHPPGHDYHLSHPVTGRPVIRPTNGWRYTHERMLQFDIEGRLRWGKDHRANVSILRRFDPDTGQLPRSVETVNPTFATRHLTELLGHRPVGVFPKDHQQIARWIRIVTGGNTNAVILDPMAGTGTTGEAAMLLNAADGGDRKCVLIEEDAQIVESIMKPRLAAASSQY